MIFKEHQKKDPALAKPLPLPSGKEAGDEEYEDELAGEKNLLEDEPGKDGKHSSNSGLLQPQKRRSAAWRYGIWLIGVLFTFLGAVMITRSFVADLKLFHPLNFFALAFVISGMGIVARKGWARIFALVYIPIAGALTFALARKVISASFHQFLTGLMVFLAMAFVYLLLPQVRKEFPRRKKMLRQELRMARLVPPPREVPFSLKLSIIFGEPMMIMNVAMVGFVFLLITYQVRKLLGGFHFNIVDEPVLSLFYLVPVGFFIVLPFLMWLNTKAVMGNINLLVTGALGHAVLKKKVVIPAHDTLIYRLTFEYEVDGVKYKLWDDAPQTASLEDEANEPLIYNPLKPQDAMLLDSLPAHITIDEMGRLKHRYAFMGYLYASLPVIMSLAVLYFTLK